MRLSGPSVRRTRARRPPLDPPSRTAPPWPAGGRGPAGAARARPPSRQRSAPRRPRRRAHRRPGGWSRARFGRSTSSEAPGQRAPIDESPAYEPERVEALLDRMAREHEPRCRVRGAKHPLQSLDHPGEPAPPAQKSRRALVAGLGRGLGDTPVDLLDQRLAGAGALEVRQNADRADAGRRWGRGPPGRETRNGPSGRRRTDSHAA